MYFTNYENHRRPELFGLLHMPLRLWKTLKCGTYFYRVHYRSLKPADYIDEKIINLAKKNKNFYILLDDSMEGYAYLNFIKVYKFVIKHNLQNKILYVSGHLDAQKEYKNWLKNKKIDPIFYVLYHNSWFWRNRDWSKDKNINANTEKSIWYCCLNNRPREHRLSAITYLDHLNLLKLGIVSANDKDYEIDNSPFEFNDILNPILTSFRNDYAEILKKQIPITEKKLPLIVDVNDLKNKCLPHNLSPSVYNDTLVNLVTETFYFKKWNSYSEMFITEKTWKVFTAKQIPVIIGPQGLIEKLRTYGFDMFDDIVDQSYDNEPDSTRIFSAINSLNKLIKNFDVDHLSKITEHRRIQNLNKMLAGIPLDPPVWKVLNEG